LRCEQTRKQWGPALQAKDVRELRRLLLLRDRHCAEAKHTRPLPFEESFEERCGKKKLFG
jgi:hypothetical protein